MSIGHDEFEYNRGAVRPLLCYRDGWRLIKNHYFLFLGITTLGLLIAYAVPFGILVGPVWCGFEICLFCCMAGQRPSLSNFFDGFRYFGPSALPGILLITLATVAFGLIWFATMVASLGLVFAQVGPGNPPDAAFAGQFGGILVLYTISAVVVLAVLTAPFMFVFSLIVDRQMSGFDALSTTIKAMFANFWGVVGLVFLHTVVEGIGTMLGCVGWLFVVPVMLAADIVAYRQVFPRLGPDPDDLDEPEAEMPARLAPIAAPPSTDIRGEAPLARPPETGITPGPPPE